MARMHEDQVDVTEADVRRLLAAQHPPWAELPVRPVAESGTDHALFRLGEDLVVRMPVRPDADGQAAAEARWLPRLVGSVPVSLPVPLAIGAPDDAYPFTWSVAPWLPGAPPTAEVADDPGLAVQLAAFIVALRACDTEGAPAATSRGLPLGEPTRDGATRRSLERAADLVDSAAALRVWTQAQAAPAWAGAPCWLHADLTAGNLLVQDGRISGVVDWNPVTGDPAVELHSAYQLFGPEARAAFRAALPDDEATWTRARGWAVSIAAMEIPYYRESRPEFAARSIRAIEAVLAESR